MLFPLNRIRAKCLFNQLLIQKNITFIQRLYKNIQQDIFVYIILSSSLSPISFPPSNNHLTFILIFFILKWSTPSIFIDFLILAFSDAVKTLVLNNPSQARINKYYENSSLILSASRLLASCTSRPTWNTFWYSFTNSGTFATPAVAMNRVGDNIFTLTYTSAFNAIPYFGLSLIQIGSVSASKYTVLPKILARSSSNVNLNIYTPSNTWIELGFSWIASLSPALTVIQFSGCKHFF